MKPLSHLIRVPRSRPQPCADADAFVRRHGERLQADFVPGKTPPFPVPEPLFGPLPPLNDFKAQVGTFDRQLARLKDVTIWSQEGFLVAGNEVLQETCWGPENLVGNPVRVARWQPLPVRLKGEWFSCGLYWSTYYYHWMCDVLPRFHGLLEKLPPDVRFIIHAPVREYELASLAALGIPAGRCRAYDGFRPLQPESLYYATPVAMSGDHHPEVMRWVRQKVRDYYLRGDSSSGESNLRLYISRSRTKMRRVLNEEALLPILQRHGFKIVHAEGLSFRDQVILFSKASIIAGPHGGGMTNLLWASEGSTVWEIFEPGTIRRYYWSLAHSLGQRYFMSVAEAKSNPGAEADMTIDPEKFEDALQRVVTP